MMNGSFIRQQAAFLAERLQDHSQHPSQRIEAAFQWTLHRKPTSAESTAAAQLIELHGLGVFCRALLNANEFLYY